MFLFLSYYCNREASPTLIDAQIVEEIQEPKDLKVEKPKEHVESNSQLFQDSSADFSKSVIILEGRFKLKFQ